MQGSFAPNVRRLAHGRCKAAVCRLAEDDRETHSAFYRLLEVITERYETDTSATAWWVWRGSEPHPRACAFPYPHRGRLDHFVIGELSYAPSQPLRGGLAVRLTGALPPKAIPYVHATDVVNKNPREKVFRLVTAADKCAPKKLRQNPRVDFSIGGAPEDVAPYEHAIGMVNKAARLRSGKNSPCQGEPGCV